ncbi:MAG TPA: pentapeptide repeat-containing protein [Hyphomonadaceae bacterium]|nr:pentapeptide repeat-containing protein [Hyphomonadaceae bacterium]HPN06306.1 pentapeptide repeat-containing protein [Hyphomonadaceae bacterium]
MTNERWWENWRRADYSWHSLGAFDHQQKPNFPWRGWSVTKDGQLVETPRAPASARLATLKDYWACDPSGMRLRSDDEMLASDELEHCPETQTLWHVIHIPQIVENNQHSWKLDLSHPRWNFLEKLVHARLLAAREPEIRDYWEDWVDTCAQLTGGVLRNLPKSTDELPTLHLVAHQSVFLQNVDIEKSAIGRHSRFIEANFRGAYLGSRATYEGPVTFDDSLFEGWVNLDGSKFSGSTSFRGCVFRASMHAGRSRFSELVDFQNSHFFGDASLGSEFLKNAQFFGCVFHSGANLFHANFSGIATFDGAVFSGLASFRHVMFEKLSCDDVQMKGGLDMFGSTITGEFSMRDASVFDFARFQNVQLPPLPSGFSSAFRGTIFASIVDFTGVGVRHIAAFDKAILQSKILLDDVDEVDAVDDFKRVILPRAKALAGKTHEEAIAELNRRRDHKIIDSEGRKSLDQAGLDRGLRELEGGCRAVKLAMGRDRNELLEQRFYRFQLMARVQQAATPKAEKMSSLIYATFSDYGASIWRPLIILLSSTFVMGVVFWIWTKVISPRRLNLCFTGDGCKLDRDLLDAITFAATNFFKPLWVWGEKSFVDGSALITRDAIISTFGAEGEEGSLLLLRLVSTFQSFSGIVLLFLFGLSVRRRFQIS